MRIALDPSPTRQTVRDLTPGTVFTSNHTSHSILLRTRDGVLRIAPNPDNGSVSGHQDWQYLDAPAHLASSVRKVLGVMNVMVDA